MPQETVTFLDNVYVDQDGVLANFDAKVVEIFGKTAPELFPDGVDDLMWETIHKDYPDFFAKLDPMPDMQTLIDGLDELTNFSWVLLSALPNPKRGMTQKALNGKSLWLLEQVGWQPAIFCLRSQKCKYARPGYILIDDREDNCSEWTKKGGIAIQHKSAQSTLEELKSIADSRGRQIT